MEKKFISILVVLFFYSLNVSSQEVSFDLNNKKQVIYYQMLTSSIGSEGNYRDEYCFFRMAKGIFTTEEWNRFDKMKKLEYGLCYFIDKFVNSKSKKTYNLDYDSAMKWVELSSEEIRFKFSYASYMYELAKNRSILELCNYLDREDIMDDKFNVEVISDTKKYCSMYFYERFHNF